MGNIPLNDILKKANDFNSNMPQRNRSRSNNKRIGSKSPIRDYNPGSVNLYQN
jgi:Calpain family cysteine protease